MDRSPDLDVLETSGSILSGLPYKARGTIESLDEMSVVQYWELQPISGGVSRTAYKLSVISMLDGIDVLYQANCCFWWKVQCVQNVLQKRQFHDYQRYGDTVID